MYNYNLYTLTGPMYITTDVNLLEMYKSALATGATKIVWERGILDLTQVIGIMDMAPLPDKK